MKDSVGRAEVIFAAALDAVEPAAAVKRHLETVKVRLNNSGADCILVIAFGKAAWPMCRAVEEELGDLVADGIAVTKYGHGGPFEKIKLFEASHPLPDEKGVAATREVIELLKAADEATLVLCLVSGGGSALLVSPAEGISLKEKQQTTDLLLKCGADIGELNAVRKHLSRVKGGRLAGLAVPAPVLSLILSDVIGDILDVIASGPTAPDGSTYAAALAILEKYDLLSKVPVAVRSLLDEGQAGEREETPKPGDPLFSRVENIIVGNNSVAVEAARVKAEALGFEVSVRQEPVSGDLEDVASELADLAIWAKNEKETASPLCFISGGETTVAIKGDGKGGRNMELALLFAEKIKDISGITLLSAGTDGTDGPTDAAGAIVNGFTVPEALAQGYDAAAYLANNDSYTFFDKKAGLFKTGPTGTNVMDLQILIVD